MVPLCAADAVLTAEELRCNALFDSAATPLVDVDGDGEPDLISFGIEVVSAVPVTILP